MKLLPCAVMLSVAPPRDPGGTTTDTAPWGAAPAAAGGDGGARARAARQASGEPAERIDSDARFMSLPLAARTSASVASSQCSNMALRVPTSALAAAMVLRVSEFMAFGFSSRPSLTLRFPWRQSLGAKNRVVLHQQPSKSPTMARLCVLAQLLEESRCLGILVSYRPLGKLNYKLPCVVVRSRKS